MRNLRLIALIVTALFAFGCVSATTDSRAVERDQKYFELRVSETNAIFREAVSACLTAERMQSNDPDDASWRFAVKPILTPQRLGVEELNCKEILQTKTAISLREQMLGETPPEDQYRSCVSNTSALIAHDELMRLAEDEDICEDYNKKYCVNEIMRELLKVRADLLLDPHFTSGCFVPWDELRK